MSNPKDIDFLEIISSKIKRKILQDLSHDYVPISSLAEKNQLTKSALQIHLNVLENYGIVTKQNKSFCITDLGKSLLNQCKIFDFLGKNKGFFEDHDLGDIPSHLAKSLSMISNSELVQGLPPNFVRWSHVIKNAKKFVYCIFTQPPILIADPVLEKISERLEIKILLGKNSIINYDNEFVEKMGLRELQHRQNFQKRMAEKIMVNLLVSEKEACLMFPYKNGETDIQNNFVSNNSNFQNWCLDFFNFKWESAESFARLRKNYPQ